ncbi:uncharacterized protein LOC142910703 isoform X2 [Petromyzon marinus]|uniref:uncharacterized protein LOC142910703 isoform X2 n=1 Tax=Petromyzon marinus TaxID=7757 RepID=UPI003F6F75DA
MEVCCSSSGVRDAGHPIVVQRIRRRCLVLEPRTAASQPRLRRIKEERRRTLEARLQDNRERLRAHAAAAAAVQPSEGPDGALAQRRLRRRCLVLEPRTAASQPRLRRIKEERRRTLEARLQDNRERLRAHAAAAAAVQPSEGPDGALAQRRLRRRCLVLEPCTAASRPRLRRIKEERRRTLEAQLQDNREQLRAHAAAAAAAAAVAAVQPSEGPDGALAQGVATRQRRLRRRCLSMDRLERCLLAARLLRCHKEERRRALEAWREGNADRLRGQAAAAAAAVAAQPSEVPDGALAQSLAPGVSGVRHERETGGLHECLRYAGRLARLHDEDRWHTERLVTELLRLTKKQHESLASAGLAGPQEHADLEGAMRLARRRRPVAWADAVAADAGDASR